MGNPLPGPYELDPFQEIVALRWGAAAIPCHPDLYNIRVYGESFPSGVSDIGMIPFGQTREATALPMWRTTFQRCVPNTIGRSVQPWLIGHGQLTPIGLELAERTSIERSGFPWFWFTIFNSAGRYPQIFEGEYFDSCQLLSLTTPQNYFPRGFTVDEKFSQVAQRHPLDGSHFVQVNEITRLTGGRYTTDGCNAPIRTDVPPQPTFVAPYEETDRVRWTLDRKFFRSSPDDSVIWRVENALGYMFFRKNLQASPPPFTLEAFGPHPAGPHWQSPPAWNLVCSQDTPFVKRVWESVESLDGFPNYILTVEDPTDRVIDFELYAQNGAERPINWATVPTDGLFVTYPDWSDQRIPNVITGSVVSGVQDTTLEVGISPGCTIVGTGSGLGNLAFSFTLTVPNYGSLSQTDPDGRQLLMWRAALDHEWVGQTSGASIRLRDLLFHQRCGSDLFNTFVSDGFVLEGSNEVYQWTVAANPGVLVPSIVVYLNYGRYGGTMPAFVTGETIIGTRITAY